MFLKNKKNEEANFWLSYADLMAGLLFVFILLIGAIVVKSIVLKSSLESKESSLENSLDMLLLRDTEVQKLQHLLSKRNRELNATNNELLISKKSMELQTQEIVNLNNILLSQNMKIDTFNNKIIIMQNLLNESNATREIQKTRLQDYSSRVLVLSNTLTQKEETLAFQDKKLLQLLQAIDEKESRYDRLIAKLHKKKAKIKSLTGIKIKLIAELKQSLGKNVELDAKNGSLRIASNVLFAKNSAVLKASAKKELKKVFINYVGALTSNKSIFKQLESIAIEGHTDSDGGYLLNLNLSQQRAFVVMNYLISLDFTNKNKIKPLLVASGRSYFDAILDKNGKENKQASRRIEIKFRLKNDDAMYEIEKILDYE